MAEEYPRCPVCFSQIVTDPEEIERLREEGIYVWVEDPLLTPRGLAGEDYKGKTPCRWLHIIQLQEARQQQEEDVGIPEEEKTAFSGVGRKEPIRKIHIEELRISTEKILLSMGYTKEGTNEADLDTYFNYDEEGNERRIEHQTEWTDVFYPGTRTSYSILSDDQEILFRSDFSEYADQWGIYPDPDSKEHYYDYRGLWIDEGGIKPDSEGHLSSVYKLVGHPNLIIDGINTATGEKVKSFPVRAIHIEDLRHPMPILAFLFLSNQWTGGYGQGERHLAKYVPSRKDSMPSLRLIKSVFSHPINGPVTLDNKYIYGIGVRFISGIYKWGYSWNRSCEVRRIELSDLSGAGGGYVTIPTPSMWTADNDYIYSASEYWDSASVNWKLALLKLTKYYEFVALKDAPPYGIIDATNDKKYVYIMARSNFYIDKRVKDLSLISSNIIEENSEEQIGTDPNGGPLYEWKYWQPKTLCMDGKYLYCQVTYVRDKQWIEWYASNWYLWTERETIAYFYKLDKNFNTIWRKQLGRTYHNGSLITPISEIDIIYAGELKFEVDRNYIYMLGQSYEIDTGFDGRVYIFDKETFSLLNTIENWKGDIRINRVGVLSCSDEYRFSQIEKQE